MLLPAKWIQEGDLVDLQGDPYADPDDDNVFFQCELQQVVEVTDEGTATAIGFEGWDVCGFPPDHMLKVEARLHPENGERLRMPDTTAVPQEYSPMQKHLAESLGCYVSDEDTGLDRREFLINVRDRIAMDLDTGDY